MTDCIFCKIAAGEIPAAFLYKDRRVFVIKDIHPQAPTHLLVIPREHIASLADVETRHKSLLGHIAFVAASIAREHGLADRGYRLVINCGPEGGQVVQHLHLHLLAGRRLDDQLG